MRRIRTLLERRPRTFAIASVAASLAVVAHAAEPAPATGPNLLTAVMGRLIEAAIPLEYDKQKNWGDAAEIPFGLRAEGKGRSLRLKARKRAVNHGVWKHYKVRLVDPATNLSVRLADLQPVAGGGAGFKLDVDAKIDAWARAKAYEYGVHLGSIELECDMRIRLSIHGTIGLQAAGASQPGGLVLAPVIDDARLDIDDFHLRRVSNVHGPLIRELGDGVRKLVEEELNGPRLVEKLNRAIERKRDRLTFQPAELLDATWLRVERAAPALQDATDITVGN